VIESLGPDPTSKEIAEAYAENARACTADVRTSTRIAELARIPISQNHGLRRIERMNLSLGGRVKG
jgi:hypothetical protein